MPPQLQLPAEERVTMVWGRWDVRQANVLPLALAHKAVVEPGLGVRRFASRCRLFALCQTREHVRWHCF